MIDRAFSTILSMSITAAYVIAALCAVRLVLQRLRAPKWASYALWAVAGFRLATPYTLKSPLSLVPAGLSQARASTWVYATSPSGDAANQATAAELPDAIAGNCPTGALFTASHILAWLWLAGVLAMAALAVVSHVRLMRRIDNEPTPFVHGFFRPRIHVAPEIEGERLRYVMAHENAHIRRGDHMVKPFAYALACIHWFNPLAWLAFALMCEDMETSCDERVISELGPQAKAEYSQALLSLSMSGKRRISGKLAFGEGNVKRRIKNVLEFKKCSKTAMIAAVMLLAVSCVGFSLNRGSGPEDPIQGDNGEFTESSQGHCTMYFYSDWGYYWWDKQIGFSGYFGVPQLEDEDISGTVIHAQKQLDISFTVSRPDPGSVSEFHPGGIQIHIVYDRVNDRVTTLECPLFVNSAGETYELVLEEENALLLAQDLEKTTIQCIEDLRDRAPYHAAPPEDWRLYAR